MASLLSFHDQQHISRMFVQEQRVNTIFSHFTAAIAPEMRKWKDANNKSSVWVRNSQIEKSIDKLLLQLQSSLTSEIKSGQTKAWEEAITKNDKIVEQYIKGMSLSSIVKEGMFKRNLDALELLQNRTENGLNLSQRVWNITTQTKGHVETFLEGGIATGRSADQISRDFRQLLNDPDKRFRRIRNEQGKLVLSQPMKDYHPGRGVYRSAKMNAIRVSATETNMGYRMSDCERWKQLDFVLGFEVMRSRNGHPCAVCDSLVGKYPKDFIFPGWHPFCICIAVPIVMEHDDFADYLLTDTIQPNKYVKDIPGNAKKWIDNYTQKSGSEPYFVKVNNDFLSKPVKQKRYKTAEQKSDIQARWNTRVASRKYDERLSEISTEYGNKSDVIAMMAASIKNDIQGGKSISKIDSLMKELNHKVKIKLEWDERVEINRLETLLVDVKGLKSQFSTSEINSVYSAVETKLATWEHLTIDEQIKKLKYEIDWVEDNKKYNTWKAAQNAYKKQLGKVEYKQLENEIDMLIANAKSIKPKSNSKLATLLNNKTVSQEYKEKVTLEMDALIAKRGKSIKGDLPDIPAKEIDRLLKEFEIQTVEDIDKRLRGTTESIWKTLTIEERNVLTKYTQTFSYLNEPLRGLPYYGSLTPNAAHVNDLPILTKALSKFKMQENTVVRRGTGSWTINELGYGLDKLKPGDVFTDKGFLSTAVHRDKGFNNTYSCVIVVPKGAQGAYAEPFSHYTDNGKFSYNDSYKNANLWNGISNETIQSEQEWIGQRGSKFKVLKKIGKTIYLQMIGQLQ